MIDERTEELAALYAFGLLEGAELAEFESRLAKDRELQDLVRELRETSSSLSLTAPASAPSAGLKTRLLEKIGATSSSTAAQESSDNVVAFPLSRWIPWAIAAGFAIVSGYLWQNLLSRREETIALRTEAGLAQIARQDAENRRTAERIIFEQQSANATKQVANLGTELSAANQRIASLTQDLKAQGDLADYKIAALTSLAGNSKEALAVAVWNPSKQEGIFAVDKLPALAADQDYELWIIDSDVQKKSPVSAGVFKVGAEGKGRATFKTEAPIVSVAKFAVSREKKGGAPAHGGPKGEVVMISQ